MNSKKAITLLVLATLLLSMVPVAFAAVGITDVEDDDGNPITGGDYGDTVVILGNGVSAGTTVELYWDDTTIAWNGVKGKVNETTVDNDGTFEVWFDIPESTAGDHYVWAKSGDDTASAVLTVVPRVKTASSSGEADDNVDTDVYGQAGSKDVALVFVYDDDIANWNWVAGPADTEGDIGDEDVEGDLNTIVEPGSLVIVDGIFETFNDDGDGTLTGTVSGDGKINYVTGEWEIESVAGITAVLTVNYNELEDQETPVPVLADTLLLSTGETNSVGSWMKRITIPMWIANPGVESYYVASLDAKGNTGSDDFTIGAVLTATPDEVDVGDLVTLSGRGYTPSGTILQAQVTIGGLVAVIDDYDTSEAIDTDGEWSFKVFVPQIPDKEEDYDVVVTDGAKSADVEIEVNAKAKITITPDYGPQGQTVSITGENFPNLKEEEIVVELDVGGVDIEDFETSSDGSFSGTFRIPAVGDGDYEINAFWDNPGADDIISDTADFRIGSILVLLSDDEGPTGLQVILSGNGFSIDGGWNATFGDIVIFEDEQADGTGLLGAMTFWVPQVEPGIYDITVLDEDSEIAVATEFEVTDSTSFVMDPSTAPAGYNVTFEGMYWSENQDGEFDLEFVVFNDTEEWDITSDVWKVSSDYDDGFGLGPIQPIKTGDNDGSEADDGAFTAWWYIGDEDPTEAVDVFSKGTYTLNVTSGDDEEYVWQMTFVVGDEHSSIAPRKTTFRIEETVSFDIQHSFGNNPASDIAGGMVDVFDPDGNLYWRTDDLVGGIWIKSGMYYYVPVAEQVDNNNPMVLLDDAPLGEWSYEWYEENGDDLIAEGTFTVEASREDVVSGKIDDLNNQITNLQDAVSDVSSEFDDVRSDIADVAAIAEQAVSAANTAAEAIQTVAQTANTASQAAENAAEAANAAKDAASGLTTLVYGAIGASLISALAAIVSLKQISTRMI
ncbi:hypothetical protein KAR91_75820 [Candidatus Pacearchaeota archaeon]|nr:hypothetical protein [Candidatus Pacearchaeota archaeon]